MNLSNLKIGAKLGIGFGIVASIVVLLGVFALLQIGQIAASEALIATNNLPSVEMAGKLDALTNDIRRVEARHVLATEPAQMDALEAQIASVRTEIQALEPEAEKLFDSDTERRALADFKSHRDAWYGEWENLRPLSRKSGESMEATAAAAQAFAGKSQEFFALALKDLQALSDYNKSEADASWAQAQQTIRSARLMASLAIVIALLVAVAIGITLTRAIVGPLREAVAVAGSIATGDMTPTIHVQGSDETAQLLQALDSMRGSLVRVVSQVRTGSDSVATASAQIAQGNQDLSGRTEQQASALEETASSMEELSAQVKHNAENAHQANRLATSASTVAVRGGEVVGRVVETMKEINDSSRKISEIISVIDGIAFQTNILALNAAVEAARAGEQGRGFAVVASEVRSLAGRSAEAAKEIKGLINASVERVEAGSALVDEAGNTMSEVVSSIQQVSDLVGEISSASNEQSLGVVQVSDAIVQMDQATQQNAALVEEMAAAANSLNTQAGDLVRSVSIFKIAPPSYGESLRLVSAQ